MLDEAISNSCTLGRETFTTHAHAHTHLLILWVFSVRNWTKCCKQLVQFPPEELEGCWPLIRWFIFILCKTPLSLPRVCLSFVVVFFIYFFCAITCKCGHKRTTVASLFSFLLLSVVLSPLRPHVITVRGRICTELRDLGHKPWTDRAWSDKGHSGHTPRSS